MTQTKDTVLTSGYLSNEATNWQGLWNHTKIKFAICLRILSHPALQRWVCFSRLYILVDRESFVSLTVLMTQMFEFYKAPFVLMDFHCSPMIIYTVIWLLLYSRRRRRVFYLATLSLLCHFFFLNLQFNTEIEDIQQYFGRCVASAIKILCISFRVWKLE